MMFRNVYCAMPRRVVQCPGELVVKERPGFNVSPETFWPGLLHLIVLLPLLRWKDLTATKHENLGKGSFCTP